MKPLFPVLTWMVFSLFSWMLGTSAASGLSEGFTFTSTVDQTFQSPLSGVFSETGQGTFTDPTLTATFTDTGSFTNGGTTATFDTFHLQLFRNLQPVGVTTSVIGGQAQLSPISPTVFTGTFNVAAVFVPQDVTLSPYSALFFSGTVMVSVNDIHGAMISSFHQGQGTVTLLTPEPASLLLLLSGLIVSLLTTRPGSHSSVSMLSLRAISGSARLRNVDLFTHRYETRVTTTSAMASPYRDQDGGLDADA